MSKKLFNEIGIHKLSNDQYVKSVSSKGITYTVEFKRLFIIETESGKSLRRVLKSTVLM
jgi:transposase